MKIIPAKKIVVIEPTEVKGEGKIEIVQEKQPEYGKVIAIGVGRLPVKMKIGDTIAYRKYGESKFYLGTEERLFVSFDDVLGIIKR